jgi:hypothetical protein
MAKTQRPTLTTSYRSAVFAKERVMFFRKAGYLSRAKNRTPKTEIRGLFLLQILGKLICCSEELLRPPHVFCSFFWQNISHRHTMAGCSLIAKEKSLLARRDGGFLALNSPLLVLSFFSSSK